MRQVFCCRIVNLLHIFFQLIVVMLIATSCSRTNEQLLLAEQLVETAPDSAMAMLNSYQYDKLSEKDKALYGLVHIRVQDKKHLPLEPETFLNYSLDYYTQHKYGERIAVCYLFMGRRCFYLQDYEKAMDNYLLALDKGLRQSVLKAKMYTDMGLIFTLQKDYTLARSKYFLSYDEYMKSDMVRPALNSLIDIGRTYAYENKYDSAKFCFRSVLQKQPDSIVTGNVLTELGISYYQQLAYDSALNYLYESIKYPFIKNNMAIRLYFIADVNFDLKQYEKSKKFASRAIESNADIQTKLGCYRILANCAAHEDNKEDINRFIIKYQECDDSIRKINSQTKGSYIETMHNTQKEAVKSRSWIWYLSAIVLLISIFSVIVYLRKHRKSKLELKLAEEKQLRQKTELRQEVVSKSRLALETTIQQRRNEMKVQYKNSNAASRRKLIVNLYGEIIHFNDKFYFKKEMDAIMNNLYTKLETLFPELKDKEIQWACLYELKVSRDDIMDLLDFNIESYKKMRQRFAKKTGVINIKSIDELLEKLMNE